MTYTLLPWAGTPTRDTGQEHPAISTPAHHLTWDGPVPLAQVLDHVVPAYGGLTWADALSHLHGSASDAETIAHLVRLGVHGFDRPIRISRLDPDNDLDDVDSLGRHWVLGNGMHRVAAAVSLGHPTIRCATDATSADGTEDTYIEVTYQLPGYWDRKDADADEARMDFAADWLHSFPLPDGTWVESDLTIGHGDTLEGLWHCPHTHEDAFYTALRARAPGLMIVASRCVTGAELDAEHDAEFGPDCEADDPAGSECYPTAPADDAVNGSLDAVA